MSSRNYVRTHVFICGCTTAIVANSTACHTHPSWACHRLLPFVYQSTSLCRWWHCYAFEQHNASTLVPLLYHVHHQTNTNTVNPSPCAMMTSPSTTQPKMWHRYSQSAPSADGQDFNFRRRNTARYSKYDGAVSYHSGFAITSDVWEHFFVTFWKKRWMTMTVSLFGRQKLAFLYCTYIIANPCQFFQKALICYDGVTFWRARFVPGPYISFRGFEEDLDCYL